MPNNRLGVILFMLLIFPAGLLLHIIFVDASTLLSLIGDTFGKALALCGINGIVVSEKPAYMWAVYLTYMLVTTILGIWLTVMLKNLIERVFLASDKSAPEETS